MRKRQRQLAISSVALGVVALFSNTEAAPVQDVTTTRRCSGIEEPAAGSGLLCVATNAARYDLDLSNYELPDPVVESDLVAPSVQ